MSTTNNPLACHKRVLLLAVSCKKGGLCPGGIDLDNPSQWIRIVRDDGQAGAVQGREIDFAEPLDVIEFDGKPMPQGKQRENWVILNNSCRKTDSKGNDILEWAYQKYSYHGFWGNFRSYLDEMEFAAVTQPSESILKVSNVRIYKNESGKAKIDFDWSGSRFRMKWISLTDQNFYDRIDCEEVTMDNAMIVVSIPKGIDDWTNPNTGQKQAYKFVSKVFEMPTNKSTYTDFNRNRNQVSDDLPF
jgi:hypothetical protein